MVNVCLYLTTKDRDTVEGVSEVLNESDFIVLVTKNETLRYNKNFVVSFTTEEN